MAESVENIRVLLADDHQMVRQGLKFFLSTQPGFAVVGEANNGLEAVSLVDELTPDVVLMDLVMPELDGLAATQVIKSRHDDIEVLVLTSYVDDEKVVGAIRMGAAGYLMKDVSPVELARAIHAVARGEVYLHQEAARHLAEGLRPAAGGPAEPGPDTLTEREIEILRYIARGLNNQDIAEDLVISPKTVKAHVSHILQKLGLESRVQAALYALRHNVVPLDEV